MHTIFENRKEAGKQLAIELARYKPTQPIILALPRGGVPVGFEIAHAFSALLDVICVRKVGAPHNAEFGIGAVAEGNVQVLDTVAIEQLRISKKGLKEMIAQEKEELKRRVALYRNNKPLPSLKNRTVIVVDDGLATGVTARAAILSIKKHKPHRIIFVSPICSPEAILEIKDLADTVFCFTTPEGFEAVGQGYRTFYQIPDEEVLSLLKQNREEQKEYYKQKIHIHSDSFAHH